MLSWALSRIKMHCEANGLAGAARRIFQKRLEIAYSRKSSGPRIHLGVIVVALIGVLIHYNARS